MRAQSMVLDVRYPVLFALCSLPIPHILYQDHKKYTAYCVFPFTRKLLPAMISN